MTTDLAAFSAASMMASAVLAPVVRTCFKHRGGGDEKRGGKGKGGSVYKELPRNKYVLCVCCVFVLCVCVERGMKGPK